MSSLSLYDILEVSPRASSEVIRAAYKSLMQRNHPDKSTDPAAATARTALIAQAYGVLSDPQRRLAYDESLVSQSAAEQATEWRAPSKAPLHPAPTKRPGGFSTLRSWYAPALIVCIMVAGAAILVLSRGKATSPSSSGLASQGNGTLPARIAQTGGSYQGTDPSVPGSLVDAPAPRPTETLAELQARTLSAFATDLAIELNTTDPTAAGQRHILIIPNLGLRLAAHESARWTPRIQADRAAIIQQLLVALAKAPYLELVKADGELYLKNLIVETVIAAVGFEPEVVPTTAPTSSQVPRRPLEVLLPLAFSVQ
jgi:hypothetical protein